MSNALQEPMNRRCEDLEDLHDLLAAERAAQDRPGIPWEKASQKYLKF